jgi:hypothetical protein
MVHGILQFTPSIAFRYVLHRCKSRDIRCRESYWIRASRRATRACTVSGADGGALNDFDFLGAFGAGVSGCSARRSSRKSGAFPARARGQGAEHPLTPPGSQTDSRVALLVRGFDNDPSAGSPTETLLRLLLPLNDKVQWTSHNVAGSEPPTSPRSEHFTGPFNR